jgi:hypothetical protein
MNIPRFGSANHRNRDAAVVRASRSTGRASFKRGVDGVVFRFGKWVRLDRAKEVIAGAIVAATHHYWSNLNTLKQIGSALLATVLWPLILLGINLHIH